MAIYAIRSVAVNTAGAVSTASGWIPMDFFNAPFNVGFGCVVGGDGTIVYRVEHTFDDIQNPSVSANVFVHPDVSAENGVNADGNYAYGVRGIRIASVSASGSAHVTMTVIQAGW